MDDQLLPDFLSDAEDIIAALYEDIESLRERRREGAARRELIGRIFRHVHTLKGSAASAGLAAASEIAHALETLLDGVRLGRMEVSDVVLELFAAATDALDSNLSAIARGTNAPMPSDLIERLLALSSQQAPLSLTRNAEAGLESLPDDVARTLGEYERQRLSEAAREGARVLVVTVDFDLTDFDERLRALQSSLAENGEVVSTIPDTRGDVLGRINFRLVCATREKDEQLMARLIPFGATVLESVVTQEIYTVAAARTVDENEARAGDQAASPVQPASRASTLAAHASTSSSARQVRVSLDELDELIAATHELFTDINGVLDLARTKNELTAGDDSARIELESRAPRIRERFHALEERLIGLRMVTLRQTLERAARVGEAAARASGREVEFELVGADVRLDKSLAEALAEPLLHLLRNAVDHGLETPDERKRAGKQARGRIRIEAAGEINRVVLRVADDGRGVDPDRVARVAAARGLIARGAHVTEQQALRLIFRPGFSTSAETSSVSGRGVGLDVIERAVERVGGELRVSSTLGAGTTFELRLPVPLALVSALIVRSAGNLYCLDAACVAATCDVSRAEVSQIDGEQIIIWRDESLPLVNLRALLGQPPTPSLMSEKMSVVISRVGVDVDDEETGRTKKLVAVVVDDLEGQREVLVRGLGRYATRWRGVTGATELRDSAVALMLDLPGLL